MSRTYRAKDNFSRQEPKPQGKVPTYDFRKKRYCDQHTHTVESKSQDSCETFSDQAAYEA